MKHYTFNVWKLKELMRTHGIDQKDLAIILDISANQVSAKLNGRQKFWADELVTIANHFGEHPGNFFTLDVGKPSTHIVVMANEQQ